MTKDNSSCTLRLGSKQQETKMENEKVLELEGQKTCIQVEKFFSPVLRKNIWLVREYAHDFMVREVSMNNENSAVELAQMWSKPAGYMELPFPRKVN